MYGWVAVITLSVVGMIALGVYFEIRPPRPGVKVRRRLKGVIGTNLVTFVLAEIGLLVAGVQDVFAQTAPAGPAQVSTGLGLALIGIGLPTGLAAIGAGIAVGPVGASSLAIISEKPEMFGRTLIYLGLAEGIAIYGVVITIMLLGKIS